MSYATQGVLGHQRSEILGLVCFFVCLYRVTTFFFIYYGQFADIKLILCYTIEARRVYVYSLWLYQGS